MSTPRIALPSLPASPRAGEVLRGEAGTYRVRGFLGRGGMAHVLDVEDGALGKRFALKLLDPALARDEANVDRFEREARALARLDHPHIVAVVRLDRTLGPTRCPFYVMERLRGGTLRDAMNRGPMPVARAIAAVEQLFLALQYVHDRGIVHRDVKPSNLFLHVDAFGEERARLLDFGVMLLSSEGRAARGGDVDRFYGTAQYAAPEQLEARTEIDPAADVYGAGLVLYEALAGRHPFADVARTLIAAREARRSGVPRLEAALATSELDPNLVVELDALARGLLCRRALGRPTAATAARVLGRIRAALASPAPAPRAPRTRTPEPIGSADLAAPTEVDDLPGPVPAPTTQAPPALPAQPAPAAPVGGGTVRMPSAPRPRPKDTLLAARPPRGRLALRLTGAAIVGILTLTLVTAVAARGGQGAASWWTRATARSPARALAAECPGARPTAPRGGRTTSAGWTARCR